MVKRSEEPFCCCEYVNEKNERSSILACCCDCEAVDEACDRVMRCSKVEGGLWDRVWNTISDRLRIPWYGGAVQARLDIGLPVLLIPTAIVVAAAGQTATRVVLTLLPVVLFVIYQCWRRRERRVRSQFFFAWTMTSMCTVTYVFTYSISVQREVLLWEAMTLLTLTFISFYCLYLTKLGAGIIRVSRRRRQSRRHHKENGSAAGRNGFTKHSHEKGDWLEKSQKSSFIGTRHRTISSSEGLREEEVTWVDSRTFKDGQLVTWCSVCHVNMPARSHHCSVCNVCIAERDHHCVWIDQCIGERNHLTFFLGLFFFLLTTCYAIHLTLTSVCTPEMYWDWFLFPADCRFVYADFPSAVTWVCVCYCVIPICIGFIVLIQQFILISQNITLVELHRASSRGWTRMLLFAKNNINNHGFVQNWRIFLNGKRAKLNRGSNSVV